MCSSLSLLPLEVLQVHLCPFLDPSNAQTTKQTCSTLNTAIQRYNAQRPKPFVLREERFPSKLGMSVDRSDTNDETHLTEDDRLQVYQVEPLKFTLVTQEWGRLGVEVKVYRPLWTERGNQRYLSKQPAWLAPDFEVRVRGLENSDGPELYYWSAFDKDVWTQFEPTTEESRNPTRQQPQDVVRYLEEETGVRHLSAAIQAVERCIQRLPLFGKDLPAPDMLLNQFPALFVPYLQQKPATLVWQKWWTPSEVVFEYRPAPTLTYWQDHVVQLLSHDVDGTYSQEYARQELPWWYRLEYDSLHGTYAYDSQKCCYRVKKKRSRGTTEEEEEATTKTTATGPAAAVETAKVPRRLSLRDYLWL